MKTILSLLLTIVLISCKKETTINPITSTNNYTQVGIQYIGGKYSGGVLKYYDKQNNPISINDSNFEIDVTYLDSLYVNFAITSSINLPTHFKNFKVKMKVLSENLTNTSNQLGWYYLDGLMFADNKLKPIIVNHLVYVTSKMDNVTQNNNESAIIFQLQKANSNAVNGSITKILLHSEFGESLSISECKRK